MSDKIPGWIHVKQKSCVSPQDRRVFVDPVSCGLRGRLVRDQEEPLQTGEPVTSSVTIISGRVAPSPADRTTAGLIASTNPKIHPVVLAEKSLNRIYFLRRSCRSVV